MKTFRLAFTLLIVSFTVGCGSDTPSAPLKSDSGAVQAKPVTIPLNANGQTAEQQNINDRIAVTNDPTKVLWVHLIALDGRIIRRMPVRGKVTSSNKRLEPKHYASASGEYKWDLPTDDKGYHIDEKIGPDGTYGESDNYIFWFDTLHRYHQYGTAGGIGYLLTDYPIDLANPMDAITGMYNVQKEAYEWQQQQEHKLKAEDAKAKANK
jgi:hypothetical protein